VQRTSLTYPSGFPEKDVIMSKASDYLFTSESVSEGHPDKVADQVSDLRV